MKKALLVVDMQNVCVGEKHAEYFKYDREKLIASVNRIISGYDGEVVYILNVMKRNLINRLAPFHAYEGSFEAEIAEEVKVVSDNFFTKYSGDAFGNPKLKEFLDSRGITDVEIIGVDGGGCVSLTALGAVKSGYAASVNTAGVGTMFEKKQASYFEKLRAAGGKII